jgi:hypothetical protein
MAFILPAAVAATTTAVVGFTKAIQRYRANRDADREWDASYVMSRLVTSVPNEVEGIGVDVQDFVLLRREAEPIGEDPPKRYDNRGSKSEAKFTVRATQTWRRQYTVQTENLRTVGGTAAIGLNKVVTASLQGKLEQALRKSFSVTDEVTQTFDQSFEVTVPPGKLQLVTLAWKRIWQVGNIKLLLNGESVEVPYRVLIGVDYDPINKTAP